MPTELELDLDLESPGAAAPTPTSAGKDLKRCIYGTFCLGDDLFAIEMSDLQEVVKAPDAFQKMPLAPDFLRGLFNLRGTILPVIDLHLLLRTPEPTASGAAPCLAVLRQGAARVGVLFDGIGGILRLAPGKVVPVHPQPRSNGAQPIPVKAILCQGEQDRVIQVLDLTALLSIQNLPLLERISGQDEAQHSLRARDLNREKLVGFKIGDCNLALEMKCVVAIIDNKAQKPSPYRSSLCSSIVSFLGRMIPVIQMGRLLDLQSVSQPQRIVICRIGEEQIGFEVDDVTSIIPYSREKVLPIPILAEHRAAVFYGCFTDRNGIDFIVLNEQGTLSKSEITETVEGFRRLSAGQASVDARKAAPFVKVITFRMGKLYALKLHEVMEVLNCPAELIHAPNMPGAVLGVMNLRGTPISVLDPRKLFDLQPAEPGASPALLVFQHENRRVAIRVDEVESIVSLSTAANEQLPPILFRDEKPKLHGGFERGAETVSRGVKTALIVLSANEIVAKLIAALEA